LVNNIIIKKLIFFIDYILEHNNKIIHTCTLDIKKMYFSMYVLINYQFKHI